MAEAFLNSLGGDRFEAHSAGFEPAPINPLAIEVMKEIGIDISKKKAQSVFDLFKRGELYSYVIAVCDAATAQKCPVFPGLVAKRIDWSFEDPASFKGTHDEKIKKTRQVRDAIKQKIEEFIKEMGK